MTRSEDRALPCGADAERSTACRVKAARGAVSSCPRGAGLAGAGAAPSASGCRARLAAARTSWRSRRPAAARRATAGVDDSAKARPPALAHPGAGGRAQASGASRTTGPAAAPKCRPGDRRPLHRGRALTASSGPRSAERACSPGSPGATEDPSRCATSSRVWTQLETNASVRCAADLLRQADEVSVSHCVSSERVDWIALHSDRLWGLGARRQRTPAGLPQGSAPFREDPEGAFKAALWRRGACGRQAWP